MDNNRKYPQINPDKNKRKTYLKKEEESHPRRGVSHPNKPKEPKKHHKKQQNLPLPSQQANCLDQRQSKTDDKNKPMTHLYPPPSFTNALIRSDLTT